MTSPGGQSRGAPAFEQLAADTIGSVRGQRRYQMPPDWEMQGYAPAEISGPELEEAKRAAAEDALVCKLCASIHRYPGTVACPRVVEADLDGDGKIRRVVFRTDRRWLDRVSPVEDSYEEAGDDG